MTTYNIEKMRVVFPSDKMREKHPDRFATVLGVFHTPEGVKLSFNSKAISIAEATSKEFNIDLKNSILTVPSGERGRKATPSVSQNDIEAALKALRK